MLQIKKGKLISLVVLLFVLGIIALWLIFSFTVTEYEYPPTSTSVLPSKTPTVLPTDTPTPEIPLPPTATKIPTPTPTIVPTTTQAPTITPTVTVLPTKECFTQSGYMTAIRDKHLPVTLKNREVIDSELWNGFIALPDCSHLGWEVYVKCPDSDIGPLLVIDCARERDLPYLKKWNIVADVFTWAKWNECVLEGKPGGAWVTFLACKP